MHHRGGFIVDSKQNMKLTTAEIVSVWYPEYSTYLKSKNCILSITTVGNNVHEWMGILDEYSLSDNKCNQLNVEIPDHLYGLWNAGYAMNKSQEYLFIFGGEVHDY